MSIVSVIKMDYHRGNNVANSRELFWKGLLGILGQAAVRRGCSHGSSLYTVRCILYTKRKNVVSSYRVIDTWTISNDV